MTLVLKKASVVDSNGRLSASYARHLSTLQTRGDLALRAVRLDILFVVDPRVPSGIGRFLVDPGQNSMRRPAQELC